jgi:hypothetical protein
MLNKRGEKPKVTEEELAFYNALKSMVVMLKF